MNLKHRLMNYLYNDDYEFIGLFHSDLSSKLDYPMISFLIEEEDG